MRAKIDYEPLVKLLGQREEPMKREHIAGFLCCSVRAVKRMAEAARMDRVPVGYSTKNGLGGLYLCRTPAEIKQVIKRLDGQAHTLWKESRALRLALTHMENREMVPEQELFPKKETSGRN